MNLSIIPAPHPDPDIDALRPMITSVVLAFVEHGIRVHASWLDPRDPRDATILYSLDTSRDASSGPLAAVWDEETGWRSGDFVSGSQGSRTTLTNVRFLGGGLLPDRGEVARMIAGQTTAVPQTYRRYTDSSDGFETALRAQEADALMRS